MILLLSPITPHICQQLWFDLGHEQLLLHASWPKAEAKALEQDALELVVQVNGKLRSKISVASDMDKSGIESAALADSNIQKFIGDQSIKRVIVVPNRLVNIVV